MKTKIKQILCGLSYHKFQSIDTGYKINNENNTVTITETCCKCGKKFSFATNQKFFGL